jgi:hypothetical protein
LHGREGDLTADLTHDPVVAGLSEPWDAVPLLARIIAGVLLDPFDLGQGRKSLADLLADSRQAVDILPHAEPLAPAISLGELLGQLVEPAIIAGIG